MAPPEPAVEHPQTSFLFFRSRLGDQIVQGWIAAGQIPYVLLVFLPRIGLSYLIISVGMMARAIARLAGTPSSYERKANLRILIITDYMPPQTHGIAIRFRNYIDNMRKHGHEVQVFTTNITKDRETSFDHPNLPSIVNPFNVHNKIAYTPGVKLSYYLSAKQWDIVHLVYPSLIGLSVLPVCAWRRIPIYCSHHVDMEYYIDKYMHFGPFARLGTLLYSVTTKLPAMRWATVNAAPTFVFLDSHMPHSGRDTEMRKRIPSGVVASRFRCDDVSQLAEERRELLRLAGADPSGDDLVWLMVQRLAPEKSTMVALQGLAEMRAQAGGKGGEVEGRAVRLVIAGDGPARKTLEQFAAANGLPVAFLGNLKNDALPPLYRAADVFITCSTSETYGLTVLEALACGTPVVMPHCAVFDELWAGKVPDAWRYPVDAAKGPAAPADGALPVALRAASARACKERLLREPIKASWADATDELLTHYDEAITANLPYRKELDNFRRGFTQLLRAALLAMLVWWLLKEYAAEFALIASRLAGMPSPKLTERKVSAPWAPIKPLIRFIGGALKLKKPDE